MPVLDRWAPTALDRRGIALPVALLALVALTLMVTTVMLTSGSQGAAATAHADATQSLYDAESGLQSYVIAQATQQNAFTVGASTVTVTGTTRQVQVTRALLFSQGAAPAPIFRTWAVTAEGIRRDTVSGRAVTALVRQYTPSSNIGLNIQSAITLGGDLDVNGNAFTVNGQNSCGQGAGYQAVQSAYNSNVTTNGSGGNKFNNFTGVSNGQNTTGKAAIDSTGLTRTQLVNQVLGNKTLASIIALVPISKKWCWTGTCQFRSGSPLANRPLFSGTMAITDSIAVVDGGGGTVSVSGGSGVLIITNGGVSLGGNAVFNGVIIVEGNFSLAGTPTVTGALISLAMTGQNEINVDTQDNSGIAGHVTVQYDQCKVSAAMNAFASQAQPPTTSSTTFAWAELVR
ncbi:MAG TPA: hypothetical protein VGO40_02140 [Longimicrobium sp.]|jgi:hypothetical protein|nr:hypothetical protein [Longimicrobium sp.]